MPTRFGAPTSEEGAKKGGTFPRVPPGYAPVYGTLNMIVNSLYFFYLAKNKFSSLDMPKYPVYILFE